MTTKAEYINVSTYATGNGTADDTTGINNAESAAYAAKLPLLFPAGMTFMYNGSFQCRVSILGYGSTLKQKNTTFDAGSDATLKMSFLTGAYIKGLTVDGISKRCAVYTEGCTNFLGVDVTSLNSVNFGFGNYTNTNTLYQHCSVVGVVYGFTSFPTSGGSADGFYFGGCFKARCIDCYVENFRRIGYVSEANGPILSDHIIFERCWAKNANHCDDSTTEYNAAIWFENTDNCAAIQCIGENISSGVAQTRGTVEGIFLSGGQSGAPCAAHIHRCGFISNTVRLPDTMFAIEPDSGYVDLRDCFGDFGNIGVVSGGTPTTFVMDNINFNNVTTPFSP